MEPEAQAPAPRAADAAEAPAPDAQAREAEPAAAQAPGSPHAGAEQPEEPLPEADASPVEPEPRAGGRRTGLFAAIALVLTIGVGALAWWASTTANTPPAPPSRAAADAGAANRVGEPTPTFADADIPLPAPYTVEPGDSLAGIAAAHDTSVDALRIANGLANVDAIRIGQELLIPPSATLVEPIDRSSTLQDVSRRYQLSPALIAAYNKLDPARVDTPLGRTELLVPDRSRLAAPAVAAWEGETVPYTVEEGDTLLSIAAQFDVDPEAIMAANRLANADLIVMGTELRIPSQN